MKGKILLVCLMLVIGLKAQQVKQGLEYVPPKDFYPIKILGELEGQVVVLRASSDNRTGYIKDLRFEVFDSSSLNKTADWNLVGLFQDRQQFFPEDVRIWGGCICVFGSSYDKALKTNMLLVRCYDTKGQLKEERKLLSAATSHYEFNRHRFEIHGEPHQERLAVISLNETEEQNASQLRLALYDKRFNEQKLLSSALPFQGRKPSITQVLIDDPGNAHVLLRGYKGNDTLDAIYSLYAIPVLSDEVIEYQLDIPGKSVNAWQLALNADDKLLLCALLRDDYQKPEQISSLCYLRINRETGQVESKNIVRLDATFKALFAGDESAKGNNDEFNGFVIRNVIPGRNNGFTLLAEKYLAAEECESDYRTGVEVCHMHYRVGKVLAVSFNAMGEIDWFQFIRKEQHTQDDEGVFTSFVQLNGALDKIDLLFNTSVEKMGKLPDEMVDPDKSEWKLVELNSNGQVSETRKSQLPALLPRCSYTKTPASRYVLGQARNSSCLLKVEVQ